MYDGLDHVLYVGIDGVGPAEESGGLEEGRSRDGRIGTRASRRMWPALCRVVR